MRALTRRRAITALGGITLLGLLPRAASADLFGADLGPLTTLVSQMVVQIAQFAQQISQFGLMVQHEVAMIQLMQTELSAVSHGNLMALMAFIQTARMSYGQLAGTVQSMAYNIQAIDSDFKRLFPQQTPPGTTFAQHDQYYNSWNTELLAASQIAARQQTVLSTLDQQATQADAVLAQSQNAKGEIAQLQTIVEMLRLMQGQLISINQSLATAGRVLADIAASEAAEGQLSRTKKVNSLAGYTYRGAPVPVPHTLP